MVFRLVDGLETVPDGNMKTPGILAWLTIQLVAIENSHGANGCDVVQAQTCGWAEFFRALIDKGILNASDIEKAGELKIQAQIESCLYTADDGCSAAHWIA